MSHPPPSRGCPTPRPGGAPVLRASARPLWVGDITYVPTGEGWVYLATILDCSSRRIVGWSMASHLRSELVVDALGMATSRRRPSSGLVHHSDQGSQYVSLAFTRRLDQSGICGSMGGVGSAYDNAAAESLFATIKRELVNRHRFPTRGGREQRCLSSLKSSTTAAGSTRALGT